MYIEFDTPDISEFSSGFPGYWLKSIFIQSPSEKYQVNALTSTYIRLVEAALFEYSSGISKLKEFYGTNSSINISALHRSVSHFEACISNMHRAINCFRRLRRDRDKDPLAMHLNAEKSNFAAEAVAKKLRDMRNEIHHLDEMVLDGRVSNGQPFALGASGRETAHPSEPNQTIKTIDRICIGSKEIKFQELHTWLTEMAGFAQKITDFLPNSKQPIHE